MRHITTKILLAVLTLLSATTLAAQTSGTCGDNLTWSYDADSCKLTITGYGAMTDYEDGASPWATYRDEITYISLPDGLTHIGNYAFRRCTKLASASLPSRLKSIGQGAFGFCQSITAITLPDSLTAIADKAFWGCDKLDMVRAEMTTPFAFGLYAFTGLKSTCKLIVPIGTLAAYEAAGWTSEVFKGGVEELLEGTCGDNLTWRLDLETGQLTITGSGAMTDYKRSNEQPWYNYHDPITSISLPDGLTHIGENAFYWCFNVPSIIIPESVVSIGEEAFEGCDGLESITLPKGLTTIDRYVFYYCTSLSSITLPEGITDIGNYAFGECHNLTSISFPSTLRSIGYSFGGCTGLTSLTLPEGLSEIGWAAFNGCTGLTTLTLPESLTFIGDGAFKDCTSLTTVKAKMSKPFTLDTLAFDNIGATCKLIVPYGAKEAYETAGWTDEVFKGGVEEMPGGQFGPDLTWTYDTDTRHLTIMGTGAMNSFGSERGKPWYRYQWDITSISLPDGLTSIGAHAFSNCSALATINIPESVTSIGRCAFIGCRSLNAISLPDGLTVIDYCFAGCSALTSVTLPPNVTYISEAFTGCSALTTVKALMTDPWTLGKDAFSEINPACKLIIPAGTRQAYIDAGWTTEIFPGGIIEMGDANGDGTISVADIGLMIDHVLGNAPAGVDPAIADVNDDGEVNVDDLETVIKAMLAK